MQRRCRACRRSGLVGDGGGGDAGAAHSDRSVLHLQAVLPLRTAAALPPQEGPGLQDRLGVVVQVLHQGPGLAHHDAALTQTLGLHVGAGEIIRVGDYSGRQEDSVRQDQDQHQDKDKDQNRDRCCPPLSSLLCPAVLHLQTIQH